MFDGSIKPPRVIRLSGASFLAQSSPNRKSQSRFDVYSSVRSKAAKTIRDSFLSWLSFRRDVKELAPLVDSCVSGVASFFADPASADAITPCDVVSRHPICRLVRLTTSLSAHHPDSCPPHLRRDCLRYLVDWFYTPNVRYSFALLSESDETKSQFTLLVSRFLRSFFPAGENADAWASRSPAGVVRPCTDPLSADELLLCSFMKIALSTFPYRTVNEINQHCRLTTQWYPDVLRRSFLSPAPDAGLLELRRFLKPLVGDIREAFHLLVRFWAFEGCAAVPDALLLEAVKSTLHENFLVGCSGVGDNTRFDPRPRGKPKHVVEELLQRLLRICRDRLPFDVTLNSGKMESIKENLRSEIESDPFDNYLDILHHRLSESGLPVYHALFANLLGLLERLVELDVAAQKNFSKPLEALFNVLFVCFFHFPEPPNLYSLQTRLYLWTRLLCLPNLSREAVLLIIQLLVPVHQKPHFVNDWQTHTIYKVAGGPLAPEQPQFELDASVSNLLLSGSAVSILLGLFKGHLRECCGGNILALFSHLDERVSNFSTFSALWKIFCLLINHALKIMYDGEIIQTEEDVRALMSVDDAVWLSRTFNYVFWYRLTGRKTGEVEFERSAIYPHSQVCGCGIEVRVPGTYTAPAGSGLSQYTPISSASLNFSDECVEAGLLSRRFNERFYRLAGTSSDLWLIPDAESAVVQHLANEGKGDVLRILDYIPHAISFKNRLTVFYNYIAKDKAASRSFMVDFLGSSVHIIRRRFIVEDGLATLGSLSSHQLKQVLRIVFVDENGLEEQGVDGGGLFKEFLITLCRLIFDPTYGIFEEIPEERSYYPCPSSGLIHDNHLELFAFIGKVVGKALYEQILIEPVLSRLILNLILKRRNTLDDLKLFDKTLYKSITSMRRMSAEEIAGLGLTFTCTQVLFGTTFQEDLIDDGRNVRVTKDNVESFIHQFSNFKCNRLIESQCSAFLHGLASIIPLEWLQMFSPSELELLISGSSEAIDVEDLRRHTVYAGGFDEQTATIRWFWEILDEYDNNERSSFLWFVTCCKRSPLLGFKQLQPPFCVHREPDPNRLPSVSTCLNLLKLPECASKEALRHKIHDAMSMSKGFGLH